MKLRVALLTFVGVLAGCFKLSQPAPEVREYRLDYAPPSVEGAPLPVTLGVGPLAVGAVYDRQSMVYREDTYATGAYLRSRWGTNPGAMVTDLLTRDFAEAHQYTAVQQGPSLLPNDYQLTGELSEMEERVTDDGCVAHLRLRMSLVRLRGAPSVPVLLTTTYAADEPCACGSPRALAEGLSRALAQISGRLQRDVHAAIAQDRS